LRNRPPEGSRDGRPRRPFRRDAPPSSAPRRPPAARPDTPSRPAAARTAAPRPPAAPRPFPAIEKTTILATGADAGRRLDVFLNEKVGGLSRRIAKDLIAIGAVWVRDARVKTASRLVAAGDVVVVHKPADLSAMPGASPETRLQVWHEDETLIVVEKPAGLPVQGMPSQDIDTLHERVKRLVVASHRSPHRAYVGLMHRLDRFASGAVVFSKSRLANRELALQFSEHTIRREYLAIVRGVTRETAFERTSHIHWDPREGVRTSGGPERGQLAHTKFEVEERFRAHTLVRAFPRTGRTHQIRIHLADVGHPILADPVYGAGPELEDDHLLVPRLALHASLLAFRHPVSGENVLVRSPLPDDLASAVESLRASGAADSRPIS